MTWYAYGVVVGGGGVNVGRWCVGCVVGDVNKVLRHMAYGLRVRGGNATLLMHGFVDLGGGGGILSPRGC